MCLYGCNKKTNWIHHRQQECFIGDYYVYSKLFSKQAQLKPTKTRNSVEREPPRKRIRQSVRECSVFNYKKTLEQWNYDMLEVKKCVLKSIIRKLCLSLILAGDVPFLLPREGWGVGEGLIHDFHCYETLNNKTSWKKVSVSQTMKSAPVLYMVTCLPRDGFIFTTNISVTYPWEFVHVHVD